jgi:hypothetical protein
MISDSCVTVHSTASAVGNLAQLSGHRSCAMLDYGVTVRRDPVMLMIQNTAQQTPLNNGSFLLFI